LKRGEIWTVAGGSDYTGKPRPVIIIQANNFDATESITVCGITSTDIESPLFRVSLEPSSANGPAVRSFVMTDKINAVRKTKLGMRIGEVSGRDMLRIDRGIALFLGLARNARRRK
jgi:mRNA interferase MazF